MQQPSPQSDGTYGLGLERFLVRGGHVMIGHGGYFGAFAAVWPEADMIVVATLNQSTPSTAKGHTETVQDLVAKVCRAFQRERRRSPATAPQSRTPRTRQQIPPVAGTTQKP